MLIAEPVGSCRRFGNENDGLGSAAPFDHDRYRPLRRGGDQPLEIFESPDLEAIDRENPVTRTQP